MAALPEKEWFMDGAHLAYFRAPGVAPGLGEDRRS
jgi:hypothetical protein